MDRRSFLKASLGLGGTALSASLIQACSQPLPEPSPSATPSSAPSSTSPPPTPSVMPTEGGSVLKSNQQIALVKTMDRKTGVDRALDLLGINPVQGKDLFIKPNFNSSDPPPGSTHNDTISALVGKVRSMGAGHIRLGDRSGMGDTAGVMRSKGIDRMAGELDFEMIVFDHLDADDWELIPGNGNHWQRGYAVPKMVLDADGIVQTCCLKTHRYGGHFTLSLKNSVGFAAKRVPGEGYDYMTELHNSSHQRKMIAELNTFYHPDLIVLDGVEAFVDGGPARGTRVEPGVILAGTDRVAIDAIGVTILRMFGTTREVSDGPLFNQEQILRAVELGLGVESPDQIELITDDPESEAYAAQIRENLIETG